jgi:hypothetical protein
VAGKGRRAAGLRSGLWHEARHDRAAHGIVLTDDYNPVEYYDAANRENLRKQLAQWMTVR